jgi:8-oxo-dGTP pyrophosphatase MutT (NUDIX family)
VLIPLIERPAGFTVLLTERTADLRSHAGQICFPGGRVEAGDSSLEATALREAEEEIGLPAAQVAIAGSLPLYVTRTGFAVTPVVGFVTPPLAVRADPREVAAVFEVPLAFVLDAANHQQHSRVVAGERRRYYALAYTDRFIWGATAGMLICLYQALR